MAWASRLRHTECVHLPGYATFLPNMFNQSKFWKIHFFFTLLHQSNH